MKSLLQYFFTTSPGSEMKFYIPLIILSLALIVGSIVFSKIYNKKKKSDFAFKRLFKKLSKRLFILGALVGLLTVLRYENIIYFSMRIWLYLSLGIIIFTAYKYIKIYKIEYPKEKSNTKNILIKKKKDNPYTAKKK